MYQEEAGGWSPLCFSCYVPCVPGADHLMEAMELLCTSWPGFLVQKGAPEPADHRRSRGLRTVHRIAVSGAH